MALQNEHRRGLSDLADDAPLLKPVHGVAPDIATTRVLMVTRADLSVVSDQFAGQGALNWTGGGIETWAKSLTYPVG